MTKLHGYTTEPMVDATHTIMGTDYAAPGSKSETKVLVIQVNGNSITVVNWPPLYLALELDLGEMRSRYEKQITG